MQGSDQSVRKWNIKTDVRLLSLFCHINSPDTSMHMYINFNTLLKAGSLTLYHPPSQKSTVYGRWKKASLTAKLLGRATLILRYYVIRVLRNAVAASNHIAGIEFFVETTSASVFFLVFFLALHTDRVKERTVMVMSWTRTLLQDFLWPWTMMAVTWLTAMSVRVQLQSGRAPATRREGKAGKNKTKTVTGCGVWCREHVRWRREAALGQWRKEVRLSRSSLGRKARSSVAMWEVQWTRIGCSKPREKIQESKALQKTTLKTSCSTSSERKYYPHVLGITWTAMNLEIDLCSKLDFLHRCLEHIIWILAVACCFFVSNAFNHVLLVMNAHACVDIPDCSYSRGNSVVLHHRKQIDWKIWMDSLQLPSFWVLPAC